MKFITNIFKTIFKLPKKYLIGAVIIILLGWFFFFSRNNKTVTPQFVKVQKHDLKQAVSASGVLTGKDSVNLHFKSSGKLAYINVKVGDQVGKGQTLASLDTQDLTIALRQAQNTFRDKKAIVDKIHDDLKDVTTNETYAQRQTRTTAEVAQDNAYDSLLAAQRAFQDAVIVSPINGTVTKADLLPGQVVTTTDTIAQVVDFSEIIFETDVDEADISKISLAQKADVTLNAYGNKVFEGKVTEIVPQTKSTSNGATVVTVKIALDDASIQHIAGLNGQVDIIQSEKKNVLSIPQDALRNGNTVLLRSRSGLETRSVTTGFKTDADIEVISGLSVGDEVVANPTEIAPRTITRNPLLRFLRFR